MKSILATVGLSLAMLTPFHAHADAEYVTEDWKVLDSELTFSGSGVFLDVNGHFGVTGRQLLVSGLRASIDPGAANSAQVEIWKDGWINNRLKINYTLHYTISDWTTKELVSNETASFLYDSYGNGTGGNGTASGDIGIFGRIGPGSRYDYNLLTTENADGTRTLTYDDWLGGSVLFEDKPEFYSPGSSDGMLSSISGTVHIAPVPEPEQYALMAAGLAALAIARRRARRPV